MAIPRIGAGGFASVTIPKPLPEVLGAARTWCARRSLKCRRGTNGEGTSSSAVTLGRRTDDAVRVTRLREARAYITHAVDLPVEI
jgi:hypothetical protein